MFVKEILFESTKIDTIGELIILSSNFKLKNYRITVSKLKLQLLKKQKNENHDFNVDIKHTDIGNQNFLNTFMEFQ